MGYCYDSRGRLACDRCGEAEGRTRKRQCPHGYCQPPALCGQCWTELGKGKAVHRDCKASAVAYAARLELAAAKLRAGDLEVRAAWGDWHGQVPAGKVGVLFRGLPNVVESAEVYRLLPTADYKGGGFLSDYPDAEPWDGPTA